ncbi:hypothetical protein ACFCY8_40995 [Streptomyces noursei]|uniref:hypothetical protein n=1 Tax=Streptomyces noursei TaxID=1971 RepID=UPI0035D61551
MTQLTPTGAKALDTNNNGVVSGHPATMAKLVADRLVIPHSGDGGTHCMTEDGWTALDAWRQANPDRSALPDTLGILPKLPDRQHDAVLTAALRPDQLVAGRDDAKAYHAGEPWFRGPTLQQVHAKGYADIRPEPWDAGTVTWEDTRRSLYLTEAGRQYARQRGGIDVRRRRVVIISG